MPRSTQEVRIFPYEQAVLKELNPEGYTSLVDMFEAACAKFPERPAFTAIGQTLKRNEQRVHRHVAVHPPIGRQGYQRSLGRRLVRPVRDWLG